MQGGKEGEAKIGTFSFIYYECLGEYANMTRLINYYKVQEFSPRKQLGKCVKLYIRMLLGRTLSNV